MIDRVGRDGLAVKTVKTAVNEGAKRYSVELSEGWPSDCTEGDV